MKQYAWKTTAIDGQSKCTKTISKDPFFLHFQDSVPLRAAADEALRQDVPWPQGRRHVSQLAADGGAAGGHARGLAGQDQRERARRGQEFQVR